MRYLNTLLQVLDDGFDTQSISCHRYVNQTIISIPDLIKTWLLMSLLDVPGPETLLLYIYLQHPINA